MARKTVQPVLACLIISLVLVSCVKRLDESEYPSKIVGTWEWHKDNLRESITFKSNHSFFARAKGGRSIFSETDRGHSRPISGSWRISGKVLHLKIMDLGNFGEPGSDMTRRITKFTEHEIVLKDEKGNKRFFFRLGY